MDIVVDIILAAIFVVFAAIGIKCGFIKLAAKPVKFVLAIVLAFNLCQEVATTIVTPIIDEPITNYVSDFLYSNCSDLVGENLADKLPTLLKLAATYAGVDVNSLIGASGSDVINAIVVNLIAPVIDFIAVVIAFFGLYILSKVALWIVFGFINLMFKRGILGVLNRALGFVFFGFLGIVVAWGVAVITELVIHVPAFADNAMLSTFEGGFVYKFFNTYNPMELLLSF